MSTPSNEDTSEQAVPFLIYDSNSRSNNKLT